MVFLLELAFICFIAYLVNGMRARRLGKSPVLWVVLSVVSFFVTETIGCGIIFSAQYKGTIDYDKFSKDQAYAQKVMEDILNFFLSNPTHGLFIWLCGFGGFLIIRLILDRKAKQKIAG